MKKRNPKAYGFVKDIVTKQSKGSKIVRGLFLSYVRDVQNQPRSAEFLDETLVIREEGHIEKQGKPEVVDS